MSINPTLGGYAIKRERKAELERFSTPLPVTFRGSFKIPNRGILIDWMPVGNQQQIGSCQGQSQKEVGQVCHWIAFQGILKLFSAWFAYRATQMIDRIRGDQGSTINGGRRCAMEYGLCPEDLCPYPSAYNGNPLPKEAFDAAANFKIRRYTMIKTYEDLITFLAAGQGAIEIGINWPDEWMEPRGEVLDHFPASHGGGGHALSVPTYTERTDRNGDHCPVLLNHWGEEWGDGGKKELSPDCTRQMLDHSDTVCVGMSDLSVAKVRDIDWSGAG